MKLSAAKNILLLCAAAAQAKLCRRKIDGGYWEATQSWAADARAGEDPDPRADEKYVVFDHGYVKFPNGGGSFRFGDDDEVPDFPLEVSTPDGETVSFELDDEERELTVHFWYDAPGVIRYEWRGTADEFEVHLDEASDADETSDADEASDQDEAAAIAISAANGRWEAIEWSGGARAGGDPDPTADERFVHIYEDEIEFPNGGGGGPYSIDEDATFPLNLWTPDREKIRFALDGERLTVTFGYATPGTIAYGRDGARPRDATTWHPSRNECPCDRTANFVEGKVYDQIDLEENMSERDAYLACLEKRGGRDFFYQQHDQNGHTICGFFRERLTDDDADAYRGHRFGGVCRFGDGGAGRPTDGEAQKRQRPRDEEAEDERRAEDETRRADGARRPKEDDTRRPREEDSNDAPRGRSDDPRETEAPGAEAAAARDDEPTSTNGDAADDDKDGPTHIDAARLGALLPALAAATLVFSCGFGLGRATAARRAPAQRVPVLGIALPTPKPVKPNDDDRDVEAAVLAVSEGRL